ncbi:MAG TPA: BatD family protein, partial [Woeseiaceae bacterium]|nr:BatD family protein [Woeseiaceae bacterium]
MVRRLRQRLIALGLIALALLFVTELAAATVIASVDRDRVEKNESFTLEITTDSTLVDTPDLSALNTDFYIGQTSRLSEARIINGQVERSMSWTIGLTPKRAGVLTIPPISIGAEQSEPLSVTVLEPTYEPPGEADVFITAETEFDEVYVQAEVLYTIKIYRAVATRQPALREPEFSGAEVLIEAASDERSYEAVLNGRAYSVVERVYALFPQESGEVSISPARFEARVLRDGRITGRKIFESEARTIKVKPIPPPPDDFPDAAWLPAKDVTITDDWSREPGELRAGEPISRDITISALGQLQTQIPVIPPPDVPGLNIYPDKPELGRTLENEGIRGMRTDQYAMIGAASGTVTLPKLELPWWDIVAGEWRVASLPERKLTILPAPGGSNPEPADTEMAQAAAETATPVAETVVHSTFWRRVAEIFGVVWLLTLVAWWWSNRATRAERARPDTTRPVPVHKLQASALKT